MYITTSRKPSLITKRLGRIFARLLPRGIYENRGKKNVDEIAGRARNLGKSRTLIIHEHKGNPEKLVFMENRKEWEWLLPQVKIMKLGKLPEIKTKATSMEITGEMRDKILYLFNLEKTYEPDIILQAEKEFWSFHCGKKKLFSFSVDYAEG